MANTTPPKAPPFCPQGTCRYHRRDRAYWRFVRRGTFVSGPGRASTQRYKCLHCGRFFSDRTFRTSYWLKRPELLGKIAPRLVGCSGFRQIARELGTSPQTIARHAARLGRQSLLFHLAVWKRRPVREPVALDSFESFEYSQFYPTRYHLLVGRESHFFYGFTDSEIRRSGRMTSRQKRRRAELEARLGRPDPRSTEKEVAALLDIPLAGDDVLDLYTDEHHDYPRAIHRLGRRILHRTISSRAARTPRNPLFAINLADLLIRHSSANHKRESIAFSKRRRSAIQRLWIFLVWRNYVKAFSEKRAGPTPAQRAGICPDRWPLRRLFRRRLFVGRIGVPARWREHYESGAITRVFGAGKIPAARFAS